MQKVHDWFLPDYDSHFKELMHINGEKTYQRQQREFAIKQVKDFRTAVDIGGNVGFWSREFCNKFQDVVIFEPEQSNIECLRKNLEAHKNHTIHEVGLGQTREDKTFFKSKVTSGGHSFHRDQIFEKDVIELTLPIRRLDDYNLHNVDLIKIDTQGSEYDILLGGIETLQRCDAVLNIEIEHKTKTQKKRGRAIIELLDKIGYREYGRSRKKEVVFTKK